MPAAKIGIFLSSWKFKYKVSYDFLKFPLHLNEVSTVLKFETVASWLEASCYRGIPFHVHGDNYLFESY